MTYIKLNESRSGTSGGGSGNVTGPASSVDNRIARFDGGTGKVLQESTVTITDGGALRGALLQSLFSVTAVTEGDSPFDITESAPMVMHTNLGSGATVQVVLPEAPSLGASYGFYVAAAHSLAVVAGGADLIRVGASASTAGGTFTSSTVGSFLFLVYVQPGAWSGLSSGTWVAA